MIPYFLAIGGFDIKIRINITGNCISSLLVAPAGAFRTAVIAGGAQSLSAHAQRGQVTVEITKD